MAYVRLNALDQALDIAGSLLQSDTSTLSNEVDGYGAAISGQTGSAANITAVAAGIATVTGLTGMSTDSVGRMLTISGAATPANNGTFLIVTYNSATSVDISNASAVAPDGNNGSLVWTERNPYSLLDDLNFVRTDRRLIKGTTNFYDGIPTYQRPTAVGTNVPANLTNIASKTLDAHAWVINRLFTGQSVTLSDGYITLTSVGNLKHADATDRTGVPINDGADAGAEQATYVEIIDPLTNAGLLAVGAGIDGYRIYGRTRAGSSTSPDSVEVEFRAVQDGQPLSSSVAYTWDGYQPTTIDLYYGFRERADQLTETAFRTVLTNGIVGDADMHQDIVDIRTTMGIADNDTSLAGLLTNTGIYFAFNNLPDATPTVVDALNTLNEQIGDRNYTGTVLTDGYTITQSLQELADAITGASFTRYIERLAADINANTAHTLPGGATYTVDPTYNGQNLVVYTRGLLRDPGPLVDNNDYDETSTTQVTFYTKQKSGDHLNFFVYA